MTLGVCGAYIVFVASMLADVSNHKVSQNSWLLLATGVIAALSWVRHLRVVAITSAFGIVALITAVIATMHAAAEVSEPQPFGKLDTWNSMENYSLSLGQRG